MKKASLPAKKNCSNCVYLRFEDSGFFRGFFCEGRFYGDRRENCEQAHLERLQEKKYREKSKRCCVLKALRREGAKK